MPTRKKLFVVVTRLPTMLVLSMVILQPLEYSKRGSASFVQALVPCNSGRLIQLGTRLLDATMANLSLTTCIFFVAQLHHRLPNSVLATHLHELQKLTGSDDPSIVLWIWTIYQNHLVIRLPSKSDSTLQDGNDELTADLKPWNRRSILDPLPSI